MGQQVMFGGSWTQQKLQILSGYLRGYRKIFEKNERARWYKITYVDAFAGTGKIPRPERESLLGLIPELAELENEFRKGSARRALEIEPPFDAYVFIERNGRKLEELAGLCAEFASRKVSLIKSDANDALLDWCARLDRSCERAVVFLDPFGASVEWRTLECLASTRAVDLWILFPTAAINRMLPNDRKPRPSWSTRLTRVFGTDKWEDEFYAVDEYSSLLDPGQTVGLVRKTADHASIAEFFIRRLETRFVAVARPGILNNSKGPLFALIFAAGNSKGASAGVRIAEYWLKRLT
jgi:three-Cys-motif partner protein